MNTVDTKSTPELADPELVALGSRIKGTLTKEKHSLFEVGEMLVKAEIICKEKKVQFKDFYAGLQPQLNERTARRYKKFYEKVLPLAKEAGLEPKQYLDEHPDCTVTEKRTTGGDASSEEDDSYIGAETTDEERWESLGNLFENDFGFRFKDIHDMEEWAYYFGRFKDKLEPKPFDHRLIDKRAA